MVADVIDSIAEDEVGNLQQGDSESIAAREFAAVQTQMEIDQEVGCEKCRQNISIRLGKTIKINYKAFKKQNQSDNSFNFLGKFNQCL